MSQGRAPRWLVQPSSVGASSAAAGIGTRAGQARPPQASDTQQAKVKGVLTEYRLGDRECLIFWPLGPAPRARLWAPGTGRAWPSGARRPGAGWQWARGVETGAGWLITVRPASVYRDPSRPCLQRTTATGLPHAAKRCHECTVQ